MSVHEIRDEALKLSAEDREWLAHEIWDSMDDEPDDKELKTTLDRRWEEIVSGKVKTLSLAEVMENVSQQLEKVRANRQVPS